VGGYGFHGQTHGVQTYVVGCALASLLGMEYEQYYIQKCLDITEKNPSSEPSCAAKIPLQFAQITLQKMGFLRCDSRGIYILVPISGPGNREKKSIMME
jgi:hypothetical protein